MHIPTILLAESDREDRALILWAIGQVRVDVDVAVVKDGETVLDRFIGLQKRSRRTSRRPADLVFLDLALPQLDGLTVLRQLRWLLHEDLSRLAPVVILSEDEDPHTVGRAFRYGASGCLNKAAPISQFVDAIQKTVRYWLQGTLRPTRDEPPMRRSLACVSLRNDIVPITREVYV
jgi:DNA-binding NarL/FixJ family response regulator